MCDFVDLLLESPIKCRMPMAVKIDPDGRGAVEILVAFSIDEVGAFAAFDDERVFLFPFLHLGEGMPQVSVIPFDQLSG
jgi:hypothetical protein